MKKIIYLSLLFVFIFVVAYAAKAARTMGPSETVMAFYDASRQGDVTTMRSLIAGAFYESRKVLLERNSDYPQFLVDYYRGVRVSIKKVSEGNETMVQQACPTLYQRHFVDYHRSRLAPSVKVGNYLVVVSVSLSFPQNSVMDIELLVEQDTDGMWKIVDEVFKQ